MGRLGRPVGLKGFIGLYMEPEDLVYYTEGAVLTIGELTMTVETLRRGAKGHEIRFTEVANRNDAEEIRNLDVFATQRRQLTDGEFWPEQLVGLSVRPGGGIVIDVVHGPAQARLLIERDGVQFEVPFVGALVPVVDLDAGYVEVAEIEGITGQ